MNSQNAGGEERKDPVQEIAKYEKEATQQSSRGNPEIAERWMMATQAAKAFMNSSHHDGHIDDLQEIPFPVTWSETFEITQASIKYVSQSLEAVKAGNFLLAQRLAEGSESLKNAAYCYDYWRTRSHQEALAAYAFEEREASELAHTYRSNQATAVNANNPDLAQQWAEAACLAQEAAYKARKTALLLAQPGNSRLAYAWVMASYWTKNAALMRAKAAEVLGREEDIRQSREIAATAERASMYRSKAANTFMEGYKATAHYWTMAAYWSANSSLYKGQNTPAWDVFSLLAKGASIAYAKAAKNKTSRLTIPLATHFWLKMAHLLEQAVQKKRPDQIGKKSH